MTTMEQPTDAPARLEDLTLGSLQPHPRNVRTAVGDVTELAASIAAKGIIHPLTVVPATAKGKYRIIAGHRRHAAAKEAKLKRVPCVIRTDLADEADQLAVMLAENTERADLTLVEEVQAVQGLLELDGTIAKVTERTGMSRRRVSDRVKVAALDTDTKGKIAEHALSLDDALVLAKYADVPEDAELLHRHLGSSNWAWAKQRVAERKYIRGAASDAAAPGEPLEGRDVERQPAEGAQPGATLVDELEAKREASRQAREQREADLATAATVRAEFAAAAIAKGVENDVAIAALKAALRWLHGEDAIGERVCAVLKIAEDDVMHAIDSATSLPWLAMVVALADGGAYGHDALSSDSAYQDETRLEWAPIFEAMGYTWSTVESELLEETRARAAADAEAGGE